LLLLLLRDLSFLEVDSTSGIRFLSVVYDLLFVVMFNRLSLLNWGNRSYEGNLFHFNLLVMVDLMMMHFMNFFLCFDMFVVMLLLMMMACFYSSMSCLLMFYFLLLSLFMGCLISNSLSLDFLVLLFFVLNSFRFNSLRLSLLLKPNSFSLSFLLKSDSIRLCS